MGFEGGLRRARRLIELGLIVADRRGHPALGFSKLGGVGESLIFLTLAEISRF